MRRVLPTSLTGLAASFLAVVSLAGVAVGYFTSNGTGTAAAAVNQLSTPTLSTPTPGGGQVSLSWTAATAPGSGTVTYYVTRDGGVPAGTCPGASAPEAVTSCVDTEVPVGTHTYVVIARWRSWSATSGSKSATVATGAATHFTIGASTTTPSAGASVNLTITAKDENELTVTSYTGSKSITFSGALASPNGNQPTVVNSSGTAVSFGTATALTFTSGVAAVSSSKNGLLKVYDSGPASIVAKEGTITTTTPLAITVAPLTATKFALGATTTTPAAGAPDDLTITAVDTYGNTATSYAGSKSVVFSGAEASPGGSKPTVSNTTGTDVAFGTATAIEFVAGVAEANAEDDNGTMKLYKSGSASVKATEGSLTNSTALSLTVAAGSANSMTLAAATTTPVAAASDNLTLTAKDAYLNTATSYAGSKNITFSGAEASPSGAAATVVNSAGTVVNFGSATALTFTSGVSAVSSSKNGLMRLNKAGSTTVSATDGTLVASLGFTVSVGTAARYGLVEVTTSAGASVASPCLFTCTITTLGNSGTVKAKVAVTDSVGNTVSSLGTENTVKITTTGGSIAGTPLTISTTGSAVSTASFTYTAPVSGSFTNTVTIARNTGTTYTSATATTSK